MTPVPAHFSFDFQNEIAANWVQLLEIVIERILD